MSPSLRAIFATVLAGLPSTLHAVTPPPNYRPPVISKLQMVFSLVTHYNSVPDRVSFYNSQGSPAGNTNYAVPHLVYEPVVTLYNPYDTALTLPNVRIKIWDPPVGFRFKKNGVYLRSEWEAGDYHGLARFQGTNEKNPAASKTFTLRLQGYTNGKPGGSLSIPPGETRTFSTYIPSNWTWGLETSGGSFNPRSLYDWNYSLDFTNKDNDTLDYFGVDCASQTPGWDTRAGFQSDHLSYFSGRPAATFYPFETGTSYGTSAWVATKLTDSVGVECRALRTAPVSGGTVDCDFRVDLLAGVSVTADNDIYRSFKFSLAPLVQPNGATPGVPAVSRTYLAGDLLQTPADPTKGGKHPFAAFTMVAKAKALMEGGLETLAAGDANDLYDLRFDEMYSYTQYPEPGPLIPPPTDTSIFATAVNGNTMTLDFIGPEFAGPWRVQGGPTPDAFADDLTPSTVFAEGPHGTGIRKASIDITGRGSSYFLRLAE